MSNARSRKQALPARAGGQGMGYRDILRHYYTGVSFGTVGSGSSNGGLFGWLWSLLGL